ncbi:MAG: response regulator [Alphaproteobacteria bacterium]|nr:response regulator [Alphaproteobacteria bacterium]MCW5744002.1 response regulator [Alphaproteobacteria bacterium]
MVAAQIEQTLLDAGAIVVGPVGQLDDAIRLAESEALDGAVLDINLNGERCFGAASVLARRGIPFFFASGYGVGILPDDMREVPLLGKPFSQHELIDMAIFRMT